AALVVDRNRGARRQIEGGALGVVLEEAQLLHPVGEGQPPAGGSLCLSLPAKIQVGGYSDALHRPVEAAAAYAAGLNPKDPGFAAEASQWVNLLQLDEDNGMIFGDGGILILGIRRDRLAARDFSQIFPYVQGH
ncbi:DUF1963 domain-containing protein, partial [Nonomuraea sp. NPDC026600]|uniref:DUF1963 domain-containing protein n=1 Tax=Nonomuraea sp. NPDC026600 TaxID=3155363 RepID=UPI0033DB5B5D